MPFSPTRRPQEHETMTAGLVNTPAEKDMKVHHGGAILLVKIGTHPKLTEIVPRLQELLPQTKFYGIQAQGAPEAKSYEVVAQENELLLGAFDDWWQRQLYVEPDLYVKVMTRESQLLRMTQRVIDHDLFSLKRPNFPTGKRFESFEGRRQLLLRQVAFWDFVFRHHNISAVVTQNLPHNFWDAVLQVVAEAREIPYLCFHEVRPFLGSLYVYEHPSAMGNLEFGRRLIDLTHQKLGLSDNSASRRDRMLQQVALIDLQKSRRSGNTRSRSVIEKLSRLSYGQRHLIPKIVRSIRRRVEVYKSRRETIKLFLVDEIPERYFLIELQPASNATSLMKGFMYGDARELIAHIAHNLPSGYSLVVKESSREQVKYRPRRESFWQQVVSLPSVVLVHAYANTDVLLKDAAGLIEVGYSSLVLQALHIGTRVVILGQSHLPSLPGLQRVASHDDLGSALQSFIDSSEAGPSSSEELKQSLLEWCDETQASTLEGALSSFPKNLVDEGEYRARVVRNVAGLIATWYSLIAMRERPIEGESVD